MNLVEIQTSHTSQAPQLTSVPQSQEDFFISVFGDSIQWG